MGKIAELFKTYGEAYLQHYPNLPNQHRKVIKAIQGCRNAFGYSVHKCEDCKTIQMFYKGCGNRHCPNCQHAKSMKWLHQQLQRQLPGHHFMITFTVPQQIRPFLRSHQILGYNAMFKAAQRTLKGFAKNPKYAGGDRAGFLGVLHTWGRDLCYHPHIHFLVPGGALQSKDKIWKPTSKNYFAPRGEMGNVFRAKLRDLLRKDPDFKTIPETVWHRKWNVKCIAVGNNAEGVIKYLTPYVFRVAISDRRIVQVEGEYVTFSYIHSKTKKRKTREAHVFEFMRLFLQHVLPKGFHKIRNYGLLAPGSKISMEELTLAIEIAHNFKCKRIRPKQPEPFEHVCEKCGGKMQWIGNIMPPKPHSLKPQEGVTHSGFR